MRQNKDIFSKKLSDRNIFDPSSNEGRLYEKRLIRFFSREFKTLQTHPLSIEELGISTSNGPMMEETEAVMEDHYDEQQEFFFSFLDTRYRAYSMAYYGAKPNDIIESTATLEEAQYEKFRLIAERAQIKGNERIFNIGCGFGSLETFLLNEFPNIEIVGITPSKVQISHLKKRQQNATDPLNGKRFTLIEGSFCRVSEELMGLGSYDLVISLGVLEHALNLRHLMQKISRLLVPHGRTFHHLITSQITIPKFLDPSKTKIGLYFPGGRVWPHNELARHTEHFELVDSWFINGLNYWRTLDEWHRRFWNSIPSLYHRFFDEEAIIHWNNYFYLCKAVFAPFEGTFYGNSHYLFSKRSQPSIYSTP